MCVMLWANGAIVLKRLVHLSSTEHLVALAEKKLLWTVSVREPNLGVSSIPCWCIHPSACVEDSFTSTFKQLCVIGEWDILLYSWLVAWKENGVHFVIDCLCQFSTLLGWSWTSRPWEGLVELLLWSSGVPSPDVHDACGLMGRFSWRD